MAEHEVEPVPGLPERLPEGECILWQGASRWQSVLRNVFYAPYLIGYFALLLIWRFASILHDGGTLGQALMAIITILPIPLIALLLLVLLSWLVQRTTLYTITNRRVVMRIGIALSITFNIPFRLIESVGLRVNRDGSGDIALQMSGPESIAYLHLWPHARPWHFGRPQPQLRSIANAAEVAELISKAISSAETHATGTAVRMGGAAVSSSSQASAPSLVTTH